MNNFAEQFQTWLSGVLGHEATKEERDWCASYVEAVANIESNTTKDWARIFSSGLPPMDSDMWLKDQEEVLEGDWESFLGQLQVFN